MWRVTLLAGLLVSFLCAAQDHVKVVELPDVSVPDAEMDSRGTVHMAYLSANNIYYINSTDGGVSFSVPVRVNQETGYASGGQFRGPDLAVGKEQRVHIGWYNNAFALKRSKQDRGLMYSRMNEARTGFEPERNLNHYPTDAYSLAANSSGEVAVTWVADGLFTSLSSDGGTTFSAPLTQAPEPCECCGTRSMYTAAGDLLILYRDRRNNDRDMYLGSLGGDNDGTFPLKLNTGTWHIEACPMSGNFLSAQGDYSLAAWESADGIYFSRLNPDGGIAPPGEIKVTADGRYPVVLGNETELLVAWKQDARLSWQLFDLHGNRRGETLSVQTSLPGRRPAGVVLDNGNFLLFP